MKVRTCAKSALQTGQSACPINFDKVTHAIVVPEGTKLPADVDGAALEQLCHAELASRIYPIGPFVEYASNGGDPATSNVGYGPIGLTGVNAKTDTYTCDKVSVDTAASLMKSANTPYGVYYVDESNVIYGLKDGSGELAPFPMATIYPTVTYHPTSGALASLAVNFCHKDARKLIENFGFEQLSFDPSRFVKGLTPVTFVKVGAANEKKYKLVEATGGYDRTAEFGQLLSTNAADVFVGATAASYADGVLTITATGDFSLKAPSVLYENGIKGIEYVKA